MKGLNKIPNQEKIAKVYATLQFHQDSVHPKDLALWSQWTRLDPRLGEILIEYISKFWQKQNPIVLNKYLKLYPWPSVFGVLTEQVPFYHLQNPQKKNWNKKLFLNWAKCVMTDIPAAEDEQFFIGLYKAGGRKMLEECLYSIKPYRKWGYFAKDLLINKVQSSKKTLISFKQRSVIIEELLKSHETFTVKDYLEKVDFQIHPRQAQRDLKNYKQIQSFGHTKGKYYTR